MNAGLYSVRVCRWQQCAMKYCPIPYFLSHSYTHTRARYIDRCQTRSRNCRDFQLGFTQLTPFSFLISCLCKFLCLCAFVSNTSFPHLESIFFVLLFPRSFSSCDVCERTKVQIHWEDLLWMIRRIYVRVLQREREKYSIFSRQCIRVMTFRMGRPHNGPDLETG